MKRKVLSVLLVAAMSMGLLAGCGGKEVSNDAGADADWQTEYS